MRRFPTPAASALLIAALLAPAPSLAETPDCLRQAREYATDSTQNSRLNLMLCLAQEQTLAETGALFVPPSGEIGVFRLHMDEPLRLDADWGAQTGSAGWGEPWGEDETVAGGFNPPPGTMWSLYFPPGTGPQGNPSLVMQLDPDTAAALQSPGALTTAAARDVVGKLVGTCTCPGSATPQITLSPALTAVAPALRALDLATPARPLTGPGATMTRPTATVTPGERLQILPVQPLAPGTATPQIQLAPQLQITPQLQLQRP